MWVSSKLLSGDQGLLIKASRCALRIDHRLLRFARKVKGPQPRTRVASGINDGVSVLPDV